MQVGRANRMSSWLRPPFTTRASESPSALRPTPAAPVPALETPIAHSDRPHEKPRWLDADAHARLLCGYVYEGAQPLAPGNILARDLKPIYADMVEQLGLIPHAWQIIGNLCRRQIGPTKTYCWHVSEDGTRSRLRVYKFLRVPPCVLTDEERALIAA